MVIPFPIASFVGALATDIAFASTGNMFWAEASQWLLGVGVVMALVAAMGGFTDFFGDRRIRALPQAWRHMVGNLILVVLAAINFMTRTEHPADAVVPLGVSLSAIGVLLLFYNGWQGWEMVYRHRVGIAERSDQP